MLGNNDCILPTHSAAEGLNWKSVQISLNSREKEYQFAWRADSDFTSTAHHHPSTSSIIEYHTDYFSRENIRTSHSSSSQLSSTVHNYPMIPRLGRPATGRSPCRSIPESSPHGCRQRWFNDVSCNTIRIYGKSYGIDFNIEFQWISGVLNCDPTRTVSKLRSESMSHLGLCSLETFKSGVWTYSSL